MATTVSWQRNSARSESLRRRKPLTETRAERFTGNRDYCSKYVTQKLTAAIPSWPRINSGSNLNSTNTSRGWHVQNRPRIVAPPRDFAIVTTREVGSDDGPSGRASPAPTMLVVTRDAYQETRTGFARFRINTQPALRVYS